MRALAEYIMRGRAQAALIAVLIVPVIPQAALALVTLRRGVLDGLWVGFWAFAPTLLMLWGDGEFLPYAILSLGTLLTVFIGALLLRLQVSWAATAMMIAILVSLLSLLFLQVYGQEFDALLAQAIEVQKANLERQGIEYDEALMVLDANYLFYGWISPWMIANVMLVLVIGRWWQAMLYNPGGLRQEFYQIRISPALSALLVLTSALFVMTTEWYWSRITAFPLVLVSVSMAHQFAARQRMGTAWLVVFYIAIMNLPFYLMMAFLGFLDAWTNLRGRLLPPIKTSDDSGRDK